MANTLTYKNYSGSVEYSAEDDLLFGRIMGIRDRVLYDGENVKAIRKNFEAAVDDYLDTCKAEGKQPETPYKGSLNIRITPEVHRSIAESAARHDRSINAEILSALELAFSSEANR